MNSDTLIFTQSSNSRSRIVSMSCNRCIEEVYRHLITVLIDKRGRPSVSLVKKKKKARRKTFNMRFYRYTLIHLLQHLLSNQS